MDPKFLPFRQGKTIPLSFVSSERIELARSSLRWVSLVRTGTVYTRESVQEEKKRDWRILLEEHDGGINIETFPELLSITVQVGDGAIPAAASLAESLICLATAEELLERADVFLGKSLVRQHQLELEALGRLQVAGVKMLRTAFALCEVGDDPQLKIPAAQPGLLRARNENGVLVHAIKFTHGVPVMRLDGLRPPSDDILATLDAMTSRDSIPDGMRRAQALAALPPKEAGILAVELLLSLGIGPDDIGRADLNDLKACLIKKSGAATFYQG